MADGSAIGYDREECDLKCGEKKVSTRLNEVSSSDTQTLVPGDELNKEDLQDTGDLVHGHLQVLQKEVALPPMTVVKAPQMMTLLSLPS